MDDRKQTAEERLRGTLHETPVDEVAQVVRRMQGLSKKQLARELVKLQAAALRVASRRAFEHREAFMLMTYRLVEVPEVQEAGPEELLVWNSRDGVTPFALCIGERKYEHVMGQMAGPHLDLPDSATHRWETRTEAAMMAAWRATMARALEQGRLKQEDHDRIVDDPASAAAWHYRIALRDMRTGELTDGREA